MVRNTDGIKKGRVSMGLVIVFVIIWILVLSVYLFGMYCEHFFTGRSDRNNWDYTNFKTFLKVFDNYKDSKIEVTNCYIYGENKFILSPNEINFHNQYMVLNPIGWLKYYIWFVKITRMKTNTRVKGLWNND